MTLDWDVVRERYDAHPALPSLAGSSTVKVVDVDDERICLSQRLWQDCISRADLETAVGLLADGAVDDEAMAFAEGMRKYYASGRGVTGRGVDTGCTRGPNLTAVVLADLGYLRRKGA